MKVEKHLYQFKRGTAQRLKEVNPVLMQGEPAFEYDTYRFKIGDGFAPYNSLPYIGNQGMELQSYLTYSDLPKEGKTSIIYLVVEDSLLYQWEKGTYSALAQGGSLDPTIITLINGGSANG